MREFSRRELLVGAGAVAATAAVGSALRSRGPEHLSDRERVEYQPPADIRRFKERNGGVLILAANAGEVQGVKGTLRAGNSSRDRRRQYVFRDNLATSYIEQTSVLLPIRFEDGRPTLQQVSVVLVDAQNWNRPEVQRRLSDEEFSYVHLRGHTVDMFPLYDMAEPVMGRHALVHLGGCEGARLIPQLYDARRPIIADLDVANSAVNTFVFSHVMDELGVSNSWADLHGRVTAFSNDPDFMGVVLPGNPAYPELFR